MAIIRRLFKKPVGGHVTGRKTTERLVDKFHETLNIGNKNEDNSDRTPSAWFAIG